jgi:signal transduction histidine kinase
MFTAGIAILLAVILWMVTDTQRAALQQANDEDIASVRAGYAQEGIDEAIEVVRQRLPDPKRQVGRPDLYMEILDQRGSTMVGNVAGLKPRDGVFDVSIDADGSMHTDAPGKHGKHSAVLGKGVSIDATHYLFVGRDTIVLTDTRARIVNAFLWILLSALLVASVGGTLLSRRLMQRVDLIARTCEGIVEGRFDARIPLQGRGHEWDRLAGAINEMLSRISALLANLQQVSSDVAHDLRTPLTRMRNRLEEARTRSETTGQYSEAVARAIEDTDELLAMFTALLRISQVEAGTRASGFTQVNLSELLHKAYELYRPVAEDNQQRMNAHITADLQVQGDAELLLQLFSNLIENAICHTPSGSVINVTLSGDRQQITAAISDDGPGIPAGEIDKVTRRFYRLSRSRSEPGHGLGLALVAATAQLHGAAMRLIDAKPGLRVELTFAR